jgi:multicomponent Na+:H+ antiporter subunit G
MEWVKFGFSALFIILGVIVFAIGTIGVYKFKFVLNRMHVASLLDTMGLFFIVLGCAIGRHFDAASIKMLLVFGILWLTSPVSSHFIAKLECLTDERLSEKVKNDYEESKKLAFKEIEDSDKQEDE